MNRIALVLALILPAAALSQQSALSAPTAQPISTADVKLEDGTEFMVSVVEPISSKTASEGDPVTLKVDEPVLANGLLAIAKGALVKGTVSDVQKKGRMGKSGSIAIRVESTTAVDGQKVRLRATKGKEGEGKTGTAVTLTVLFGPLGLLKSGKDAVIKEGTTIKAYTDNEVTVKVPLPVVSH